MPRRFVIIIMALLIVVTLAVYWPVRTFEFVNYDDNLYITANPMVQRGLSWEAVRWAFTTLHASNWHPLTWLSHLTDWTIFGPRPGAHHLVSVVIHAVNSALLLLAFSWMTGAVWRSALLAGLFALHPLHVESVAWVSERKDVLSALLGLLTILAYIRYAQQPSAWRYVLVMVLFAPALMAKPMLVTLPLVLALLDYWPLKRGSWIHRSRDDLIDSYPKSKIQNPKSILSVLLEKAPLLALSLASAVITIIAQSRSPALKSIEEFPVMVRAANAARSYLWYIAHTFWPTGLAIGAPHPRNVQWSTSIAAAIVLLAITAACFILARRWKHLLVGWLWFVIMLLPVIGLVQVGSQTHADRYMYLPSIGLLIMLAWSIPALKRSWLGAAAGLAATATIVACAAASAVQIHYWRHSVALFTRAVDVHGPGSLVSGNLGAALLAAGESERAVPHLQNALQFDPDDVISRNNLGIALLRIGQPEAAREHLQLAARAHADDIPSRYNLGLLAMSENDFDAAITHFEQALGIDPQAIQVRLDLGTAYLRAGKLAQARDQYQHVVVAHPDHAAARLSLGMALAREGKHGQAIPHLEQAARLNPRWAEVQLNHGHSLAAMGETAQATECFRQAMILAPESAPVAAAGGAAFAALGQNADALKAWRGAVRLRPTEARYCAALAALLIDQFDAALRNPAEAIELAQRACHLTAQRDPRMLALLAAAQADAGDFAAAAQSAQRAVAQAILGGSPDLAAEIRPRLDEYRARAAQMPSATSIPHE